MPRLPVDPPMVVVTCCVDGERSGCLVGFHSQASIDPERYAVWISRANHTFRLATSAEVLAVHFLRAGDHEVAAHFGGLTGDEVDKFAGVPVVEGPGGVPLLRAVPDRLLLRRDVLHDDGVGDHVAVIGTIVEVVGGVGSPLRLSDVEDVDPGHPA